MLKGLEIKRPLDLEIQNIQEDANKIHSDCDIDSDASDQFYTEVSSETTGSLDDSI